MFFLFLFFMFFFFVFFFNKKSFAKNKNMMRLRTLNTFFHYEAVIYNLLRNYYEAVIQFTINMEVEYTGGGVLIFSYLFLMHQRDNFGSLRWAEAAWYEWVHWLPLWWPANSVQTGFARSKLSRAAWYEWSDWLPLWWPANSCSVISDKLCQT